MRGAAAHTEVTGSRLSPPLVRNNSIQHSSLMNHSYLFIPHAPQQVFYLPRFP